jgi:hypothetical protein
VESGLAAWIEAARAAENFQTPKDFSSFGEAMREAARSPEPTDSPALAVDTQSQSGIPEEYTRAVSGISDSLRAHGVDPSTFTFSREALWCWNPNGFVLEKTVWATTADGQRLGFREEWAARTPEVSASEICSQLLGMSTAPGAFRPLADSSD